MLSPGHEQTTPPGEQQPRVVPLKQDLVKDTVLPSDDSRTINTTWRGMGKHFPRQLMAKLSTQL